MGIDFTAPAWAGAGQVLVGAAAFTWTAQFFWRRHALRSRWGQGAYWKAFRRYIALGLPVIFAALAHTAYIPGDRVNIGPLLPLLAILGGYLLVTGVVLWIRGALTFGIDSLAMLYVYFPDKGRLFDAAVYRLIRHPVYSAACRVGMALGFWRGTWFSIAFALFLPLGFTLWLRFVEEPELIERFGEGYREYRNTTPAFWPRSREWGPFWGFLIRGK